MRIYASGSSRFRFPGHENVRMVESELGLVPEGWEAVCVRDFGEVVTGKTPSKQVPEYFGTYMPFIKIPDMHGNLYCIQAEDGLSELGVASQKTKTLPSDSICVSCIGTAGLVCITTVPSQTNQQINSVVLTNLSEREYLFFSLSDLKDKINLYGMSGATIVILNKGKFEALPILRPDEATMERFHELVYPMFERVRVLQQQNANLRRTRDLLLPRWWRGRWRWPSTNESRIREWWPVIRAFVG